MKGLLSSLTNQRMFGRSAGCAAWARLATAAADAATAALLVIAGMLVLPVVSGLCMAGGEGRPAARGPG